MTGWTATARRWTAGLAAVVTGTAVVLVATTTPAVAESLAQVTVADTSAVEPATGTTGMVFTVRLLRASTVTVYVTYQTADDSAVAGRDYTTTSGRLTFVPGATQQTATVPVLANTLATGDRNLRLNLTSATNGAIVDGQANGLIEDTSAPAYLSVTDTAVVTGFNTPATATFTVKLDQPSTNIVKVRYGTFDQSARAGQQYTATAGTLTFSPGVTSMPVAVPVLGKVQPSARWGFGLSLSAPQNASIANGTASAYVTDPDARPYVSVDDTAITRPATGTANVTVTVRLLRPVTTTTQVNYRTTDGSAVAGTDYTSTSGTLTFAPGDVTKTFLVRVTGGTAAGQRYFNTVLSGISYGYSPNRSGTVQIVDAGSKPQVSANDAAVERTLTGNTNMTFTITANPAPTASTTINYSTSSGSAVEGSDFVDVSGSVTFSAGQTSRTVTVAAKGTSLPVGDKYLNFSISGGSDVTVTRSTSNGFLLLTDPAQFAPVLSVLGSATTVPASGSPTAPVTIVLSPAADETVTVDYSTFNNNAVTGTDYTATSGTATFTAGTTSVVVQVPLTPKTTPAPDRSFYLQLGNPTNAVTGQNYYQYHAIHDPVSAPVVSVQDAAVYPSDDDQVRVQVPIRLSTPTLSDVTVNYATSNNSAVAGTDYLAQSGSVTIPAGTQQKNVVVRIPRTAKVLPTRSFYLFISAPQNAQIQQNYGLVYILANKATPYVTVTGSTVVTGASATTMPFTIGLSTRTDAPVTVNWNTNNNNAQAGVQYTASSGTVTIPPGQLQTVVTVPIAADTLSVDPTSFYVSLNGASNAVIGSQNYSYGIIEHTAVRPRITAGDVVLTRQTAGAKNAVFTVSMQPASTGTVTVDYSTSNGNAVSGTDYTPTSGTLSFAPGETSKTVTVAVLPQPAATPERYFYLNLGNPSNAALTRTYAFATLQTPTAVGPELTVDDAYAVAPASGTASADFTLRLNPAPTSPVNVSYSTGDNSARDGFDYTSTQGTVTFAAGQTSKTVSVPVLAHAQAAPDLGFTLSAGISSGSAGVQRGNATGVIVSPIPGGQLYGGRDVSVVRGTSGTQTATVTVFLSPAQTVPVSVDYSTVDNSGIAGRDYTPTSGTLTFAPGQTSATVNVDVLGSATVTGNVGFYIQLANPRGAGLGAIDDSRVWITADAVDTRVMSGKVRTAANAGVGGATVTRSGNNLPTATTTTAANGTWSLPAATTGSYTVTVTQSGATFTPASQTVVVDGTGPVAVPDVVKS